MPEPPSSIHPLCLQMRHALPPQNGHDRYTSALGAVNGKNDGWKRVFTDEPNSALHMWSSVPFRSLNVMLVSTARHSSWWNIGECVASAASRRCTFPGQTMRSGGGDCIMARICTGDVC